MLSTYAHIPCEGGQNLIGLFSISVLTIRSLRLHNVTRSFPELWPSRFHLECKNILSLLPRRSITYCRSDWVCLLVCASVFVCVNLSVAFVFGHGVCFCVCARINLFDSFCLQFCNQDIHFFQLLWAIISEYDCVKEMPERENIYIISKSL